MAHFYSLKWEQQHDKVALDQIQADFQELDARLRSLLGQIESDQVALSGLRELWTEEGIGLVIHDNGSASDWTTNSIPFATEFGTRMQPEEGMVQLKNAWYLCRLIKHEDQLLTAYGLVRTDYNFQNRYIDDQWGPRFHGAKRINITRSELGTHPILYADGSMAMNLRISDVGREQGASWPAGLWLLFIALLLTTLWYAANWMEELMPKHIAVMLFVVMSVIFRTLMLWWQLPKSLYALELFTPSLHASSTIIPSLGDFLLHLGFLLIALARMSQLKNGNQHSVFRHTLGVTLPVLLLVPVHYLFEILVVNSSFSLDLNNPFSLDMYSFVGLLVSFLILLNYFVLFRFLFGMVHREKRTVRKLWWPWVVAIALIYFALGGDYHALVISLTGGLILALLMLSRNWADDLRGLSLYTPTVLIFSLLASVLLSIELNMNEKESRKALARKLELQQNPITEFMFGQLENDILSDRSLRNTLAVIPLDAEKTLEVLHRPFSYDHWHQYRAIINLFNAKGGLMVSDEQNTGKNYFELQREFEASKPTLSNNLHYVGNWDPDGGYLARLSLKGKRSQNDRILFVRLIPERTDDILGFTDLFIDEGISTAKEMEGYSYALYADGEMQNLQGDFPYSLSADSYKVFEGENTFMDADGFSHLVYRPVEGRLVVVSRRNDGLIGYLSIFSYLFLFYLFCTTVIVLTQGGAIRDLRLRGSFRSRINLAMSSMLFVSLLLIGLLTVFYVIREYNGRNQEMISERSRSVLIELQHKLRDRQSFSADDEAMLSTLLNKFSKVFFTDINLYQLDGKLLATSRPRLFDEGLMAKVMDPTAYTQMRFDQRSSFIQQETIGQLTYLTAYVPFRNEQREVIAFMSLPYFARQYGLQQEIFSLLAALTNIYVFLILISVVMALVISNRITEPLRFIRESLKNLKLDRQNRAIEWQSDDEIGELVEEYNRTLNELVQSAELLARSERESAWREMAKQVAHEIKNPLTPMKLSIQMLQRSLEDGADNMNERIEKVTKTLIEQIDTLSNIATEFSSFAQMPKPVIEQLDLQDLLKSAAELHGNEVDITLNVVVEGSSIAQVDKEQMLRVLTNLIKNGIQAVPEHRNPTITLGLIRDEGRWVASVQDNGSGIPKELEDKIFVPNFTTKTSGMGLGLAMVKNIIETVNGKIWFNTEEGSGTTFYISLPAI